MTRLQRITNILLILLLSLTAGLYIFANLFHYTAYMESDVGAEAVYGMVLAGNNCLPPDTWVSSTENRIVSMPNLAAPIYKLCGNMNLSAGIACSLLILLLILCMVRFYAYVGYGSTGILTACLTPFILSAWNIAGLKMFALYACYYSPHIITLFLLMTAYARLLREKRIRIPSTILLAILSWLLGMQGLRGLAMVYLPLCAVEFLRLVTLVLIKLHDRNKEKKIPLLIPLWLLALSAINYIAARIYAPFGEDTSSNFRKGIFKLFGTAIPETYELIRANGLATIVAIILLLLAVIGWWAIIRQIKSKPEIIAVSTILLSLILAMLAASFTTLDSTPRYYIMVVFAIAAGCGALASFMDRKLTAILVIFVTLLSVISISHAYAALIANDNTLNSTEYAMVSDLESKGYTHGYATFDYAMMLTTYSNGHLIIAPIQMDTMEPALWLTDTRWYPPTTDPNEGYFIVTTEATTPVLQTTLDSKGLTDYSIATYGQYSVFFFQP